MRRTKKSYPQGGEGGRRERVVTLLPKPQTSSRFGEGGEGGEGQVLPPKLETSFGFGFDFSGKNNENTSKKT